MLALIPRLLLVTLLTLIIWVLVLGWWQATEHQPRTSETVLYLVALPLSLVLGYLLLSRFIHYLRVPAVVAYQEASPADVESAPIRQRDEVQRLHIVASTVISTAGEDAAQLIAAVHDSRRPVLDNSLTDGDGFPLFLARNKALPITAEAVYPGSKQPHFDNTPFSAEIARALQLTRQVIERVVCKLSVSDAAATPTEITSLIWILPENWPNALKDTLHDWLKDTLTDVWPGQACDISLKTAGNDADGLAIIDGIRADKPPIACETQYLLIGAASHLGERTIARWQASGNLFSATQPQGQIPGEVAFAIVMRFASDEIAQQDDQLILALHPVLTAQHDEQPDTAVLEGLLMALCTQDIAAEHITAIVADTDQRAVQQQELLSCITARFGKLDPIVDCTAIGTVCGSIEPLGGLVAMICAGEVAQGAQRPVICISNQHRRHRAACLIRPVCSGTGAPSVNS